MQGGGLTTRSAIRSLETGRSPGDKLLAGSPLSLGQSPGSLRPRIKETRGGDRPSGTARDEENAALCTCASAAFGIYCTTQSTAYPRTGKANRYAARCYRAKDLQITDYRYKIRLVAQLRFLILWALWDFAWEGHI